MASKGQFVAGTDGADFQHRQTVAPQYQVSAQNKSRLKFVIYLHYVLFFVMLIKLSDDILDRLDIFILQLQELYIPKPRLWEWIWSASVIASWTGLKAVKRNNVNSMKMYLIMISMFSVCPVLFALAYYFNDFYQFLNTHTIEGVSEIWQGYPVALIWYSFLVVAVQVHFFQLFFSYTLMRAWSLKIRRE